MVRAPVRPPTGRARRCSRCWSAGSAISKGSPWPTSSPARARGAASCLFVESDAAAIRALRQNIANLRAQAQSDVRAGSVMALGPAAAPLDLVLLDPPYGTGAGVVALEKLNRLGWIGEASWISLETAAHEEPKIKGLDAVAERRVGKARLTLLRLRP
jgi:16S rRNA (guanine966-N2)-methyltransferase